MKFNKSPKPKDIKVKTWNLPKPTEKELNSLSEAILNPDAFRFQEFLYKKLSYALEYGDVMIDHQELRNLFKKQEFKKKRRR